MKFKDRYRIWRIEEEEGFYSYDDEVSLLDVIKWELTVGRRLRKGGK